MDYVGFLVACCLLSLHAADAFSEEFLKRLTQPKSGGILDALKRPKIPGLSLQLGGSKQLSGSVGIGSFGFGFNLGGQYGFVPGKGGVNLPPEVPVVPGIDAHQPNTPDLVPGVPKPQYPWENDKGKPRPNWEEYEEDEKKNHGSYDKVDKPKLNPYEESKEDALPDWTDIGENRDEEDEDDFEKKSEAFNNGDLTGDGLIQPRLNRNRGRRFVESHVYHVPLLFRSNAKPFQVSVHSNPNSLSKDGSEH